MQHSKTYLGRYDTIRHANKRREKATTMQLLAPCGMGGYLKTTARQKYATSKPRANQGVVRGAKTTVRISKSFPNSTVEVTACGYGLRLLSETNYCTWGWVNLLRATEVFDGISSKEHTASAAATHRHAVYCTRSRQNPRNKQALNRPWS